MHPGDSQRIQAAGQVHYRLNWANASQDLGVKAFQQRQPLANRALGEGLEGTQLLKIIAEERQPDRGGKRRGEEIDQIATDTKYSGTVLLSAALSMTFQVGSGNTAAEDRITVSTTAGLLSNALGLSTLNLTSAGNAQSALTAIDSALTSVNLVTGEIGAAASRLEFSAGNLAIAIENLDASHSTIRDVDMAAEMTTLTKNQILLQAGTAMLAQANMLPQSVLALLGGR